MKDFKNINDINCRFPLRNIRIKKGLTQEALAFELGISQKSYSDIENSKTKLKNDTLLKIAKVLEVNTSELCPIYEQCSDSSSINKDYAKLVKFIKNRDINLFLDFMKNEAK